MSCEESNLSSTKTAILWFQYMQMVDLLRKFIKAERVGDWDLHLQSLYEMLPFFAASGHRFYLKSVHIYLQKMANLPEQHPEIHRHFKEGLHVIRRSDRCWSGLSPDLVIEQCLMRSLKTTGGLTKGRGFSETQRLLWVLSMPACATINSSMQQLTNVKYSTSEQHKEATYARVARDAKDTQEVLLYLSQKSPFTAETSLRNIALELQHHHMSMYMSLRALESISWPPWRENQLPHTYSGRRTKLSLWIQSQPSRSRKSMYM